MYMKEFYERLHRSWDKAYAEAARKLPEELGRAPQLDELEERAGREYDDAILSGT